MPPKEAPLSSRWLPSRTGTEGASGPLPPAVGRGHGGWRMASPILFKSLGAEGASPRTCGLSCTRFTKYAAWVVWRSGGDWKGKPPPRAEGARMSVIHSTPTHPWHG